MGYILSMPFSHHDEIAHFEIADQDRLNNTIGFAIYDFIHIFCSIAFIIFAIKGSPVALDSGEVDGNLVLELADEFTELILSFTLIFFIVFIYKAKNESNARTLYSFAWLLVSLSLLIPSTFEIPYLYMVKTKPDFFILLNFDLFIPIGAFLSFLASMVFISKPGRWRLSLDIGMLLMVAFAGTSLSVYILDNLATNSLVFSFQTVLRFIFSLAPLVPTVTTFRNLRNHPRAIGKK
jgi:hypothetical protein